MIPVIKIAYGIPNGKKTITEYLVTFSLQIIEANIDNIAESFFHGGEERGLKPSHNDQAV